MLSQSRLKIIRSLQISKYRSKEKMILVEGDKIVRECLEGKLNENFNLLEILGLPEWMMANKVLLDDSGIKRTEITERELEQISLQKTPNQAVALIEFDYKEIWQEPREGDLYLAIDRIQDPGNLGTLFRLAEWFGVDFIYLSTGTVDPLNPKTIQAAMGSALRMNYAQINLEELLSKADPKIPVYGTLLDGKELASEKTDRGGIIIIGNESQGIHPDLNKWIKYPIRIPRFSATSKHPESLNAAVAAGIVLNEFRRIGS